MLKMHLYSLLVFVLLFAFSNSATITISGFYDINNNGIKDAGEAGVANIKVRNGAVNYATTTDSTGAYSLVCPNVGSLLVETGWFRSQCNTRECPAGPGADNNWPVANQFIKYSIAGATSSISNLNVGLIPDWPDRAITNIPTTVPVPANVVDVSCRLSSTTSTGCSDGSLAICGFGALVPMMAQFYNQGTSSLSGLVAKLYVPPGDCVTGFKLDTYGSVAGITFTTSPTTFTCSTRQVTLTFSGTIPPAGAIKVSVAAKVDSGPATPGCVSGNVVPPCTDVEPQGRSFVLAISHIDQTGDPDSPFCASTSSPQYCATGIHDKRYNPDEVDVAGHNVDVSLGTSSAFDLRVYETLALPSTQTFHAGDPVSFRVSVINRDLSASGLQTIQANIGWKTVTYFPALTTIVSVPGNQNPIIGCVATGSGTSSPYVTCTGKGPIAPTTTSLAMDITVTIPSSYTAATYTSVTCAYPAPGQTGEFIPIDSNPCNLSTAPDSTLTNNDDFKTITITATTTSA